jgi:GH25 family lysozyme M1 (1,4-beta-N-acetylmuramidase)
MLARMLRRRTLLVDLSNNNADPIDWHALKRAGVFGALLKVSEGLGFVDGTWPERAHAARAAGLHVGGYHFARPGGSPLQQARLFVAHLGTVGRRDLHPALDLETNDGGLTQAQLFQWARGFGDEVHRLTGSRVLWYTYPAFLAPLHWQRPLGNGAGLWIAAYGPNDGTDHGLAGFNLSPWSHAVAHQFTSVGSIAGVNGHVDLTHARNRRSMLAHGLRGLV